MLTLVKNDVRANSLSILFMFLMLNGGFILAILSHLRLPVLLLIGLWFSMIVPLPILLRAEQFKSTVNYRSLPIRVSSLAGGKYLSVILVSLATISYTLAYVYILELGLRSHQIVYSIEAGYAFPHTFIARALFSVVVLAVGMPLLCAAGSFLRIVWGALFILIVRSVAIDRLLDFSLHSTFSMGLNAWVFFVLVVSIILLILSSEISARILSRRDL